MTVFEYFKAQYDGKRAEAIERINSDVEIDSYRFVEIAAKYLFGGTFEWGFENKDNRPADYEEMLEKKYISTAYVYRSGMGSRQFFKVVLTKKGLRAFHKAMF